jgi:transposase-like protein
MSNPFRYFNSSPEVIRLVVMMYVRYPLSLRNVEDLLASAGSTSATRLSDSGGPVWSDIRRRDPKEAGREHARLSTVALAFG